MPVRIAILSTPRAGTTWLRHLLTRAYNVPGLAVHNPAEIEWAALPPACVVSLHWHRTPSLVAQLDEHRFRVLTLARHPLDVLISILHFAPYEPLTARWLEGEMGDEQTILGAMPRSTAFLEYATGPRAAVLLEVSREWWQTPDGIQVYYEALVGDTHGELARLVDRFGVRNEGSLQDAIAATTLPRLRSLTHADYHFWLGRPGLWKSLLPMATAEPIADVLRDVIVELGYEVDPDPALSGSRADATWISLLREDLNQTFRNLPRTRRALDEEWAQHAVTRERLASIEAQLASVQHENSVLRQTVEEQTRATDELAGRLETMARLETGFQRELSTARDQLARRDEEIRALKETVTRITTSRAWLLADRYERVKGRIRARLRSSEPG